MVGENSIVSSSPVVDSVIVLFRSNPYYIIVYNVCKRYYVVFLRPRPGGQVHVTMWEKAKKLILHQIVKV